MASYHRNYYRNDYNSREKGLEEVISSLVALSIFYGIYKYYTDKETFLRWTNYGIALIVLIALAVMLVNIFKYIKERRIPHQLLSPSSLPTTTEIKPVREYASQPIESEISRDTVTSTPQALALYDALIVRGIKCELEKYDGYKHIDIAIPWAKINIEIDGTQHYLDPQQVAADYKRSYHSMQKGFKTIRYPNFIIENNVDEVADTIAKIARKEYYKRYR